MKFMKLYELKIFTSEDVMCGDEPFFKAVFREAKRLGLAGGSMIRAVLGYGNIPGRDDSSRAMPVFFSGSYDLPLIIELVDTKEMIATMFPFLEKHEDKDYLAVLVPLTAVHTSNAREAGRLLKRSPMVLLDEPDV